MDQGSDVRRDEAPGEGEGMITVDMFAEFADEDENREEDNERTTENPG
jgi:hypothetical protein